MRPGNDDYSSDRFLIQNGTRLRTFMARSILPAAHESNADFERRMTALAAQLAATEGVISVEYVLERRAGHIAQCVIEVRMEPRPVAVLEDARPAGGHFGAPRGVRGGTT